MKVKPKKINKKNLLLIKIKKRKAEKIDYSKKYLKDSNPEDYIF